MANFTLDDIRSAAESKYGTTEIDLGNGEVCVLRNALRLTKDERADLTKIQDALGEDDCDHLVVLSDAIKLVAADKDIAGRLLDAVGDDLGMVVSIFDAYIGGTEAGEA